VGDVRYVPYYERLRRSGDPIGEIRLLDNEAVVSALAGAVGHGDRYLTNVLATETMNRLERAAAILTHLEPGVCAVDATGRISFLNPAAEALLGWSLEDVAGEDAHAVLGCATADGGCPLREAFGRAAAGVARDAALRNAHGLRLPVDLTVSPFLKEGEVTGAALLFHDVTPRQQEEARRGARAAAREAVASLLARSWGISDAAPRLLEVIGRSLGFDGAAFWAYDAAGNLLRCRAAWTGNPGGATGPLEAGALATPLEPGEGATGLAALRLRTVVQDLPVEAVEPRARRALAEGLRTCLAIPIAAGGRAVGVIELWSRAAPQRDEALLVTLEGIAAEVGLWADRVVLETALRRSERRLSEAHRIAHLGHWSWKAGSDRIEWSPELRRIFGRPAEAGATTYDEYLEAVPPEDRDPLLATIQEALASGGRFEIEHRIRRPDGETRWVSCRGQVVSEDEEGVPLLLGVAQDITPTKAAQRRAAEEEARFRALADASLDGVALHANGRILMANAAFARMFGYSLDEVVGLPAETLVTAATAEVVRHALERGDEGPREVFGRRKDGTLFPIELRPRSVPVEGRALRVIVAKDLTEAKAAARSVEESLGYLQAALDAIPAHVAILRSDGTIHTVNDAWRRFALENGLHLPASGLGVNYLEVCDRAAQAGVPEAAEMALRIRATLAGEEGRFALEYPCHSPTEPRWFLAQVSPFVAPGGRRHAIIAHVNITASKLLEARTRDLLDRNRDLEAFAYTVSHDLKAPLRGIEALVSAALEDSAGKLPAEAHHCLEDALRACRRMTGLVQDILAFSRAGSGSLHREPVDLTRMTQEVAQALARAEPERTVTLHVPPGLQALADPALLRVVLENLLANAWKFTRGTPAPRVEVGQVARPGRAPIYYVRDNGAGFDMAQADRLFHPFERLHAPQEFEGTGVGLATVRRIVERHGGRVWAEGRPNAGATVYFTLGEPGSAGPPQESSRPPPLSPP